MKQSMIVWLWYQHTVPLILGWKSKYSQNVWVKWGTQVSVQIHMYTVGWLILKDLQSEDCQKLRIFQIYKDEQVVSII